MALVSLVMVLGALVFVFRAELGALAVNAVQAAQGRKTVEDRLAEHGPKARARLSARFQEVGVAYPPERVCLVGLKQERMLELWVGGASGAWTRVHSYPILAASGRPGPKLRQGDRQVPEGLYAIESLNPNSLYHLSLRVNYPNEFDRAKSALDGRTRLGSDIMIHGKAASVGCLAMGDPAIEEIFVLVADVGIQRTSVILSPLDFRQNPGFAKPEDSPTWVEDLYTSIREALAKLGVGDAPKSPDA